MVLTSTAILLPICGMCECPTEHHNCLLYVRILTMWTCHRHDVVGPELGRDIYLHEDSKPCGASSTWVDLSSYPLNPGTQTGFLEEHGASVYA